MRQVIVLVALAVGPLAASHVALGGDPQVLWSEGFEDYRAGALAPQATAWTETKSEGLSASACDVGRNQAHQGKQSLYLLSGGKPADYRYLRATKDLGGEFAVTEDFVLVEFYMWNNWKATKYQGNGAKVALKTADGKAFVEMDLVDFPGFAMNGLPAGELATRTWAHYALALNFSVDQVELSVNGESRGRFDFLGPAGPDDLRQLQLEAKNFFPKATESSVNYWDDITISQSAEPFILGRPVIIRDLRVENAELYPLKPGQRLFRDQLFQWKQPPQFSVGVRTELNRTEPLILRAEQSGHLYAMLWEWDFGFLPLGPKSPTELNGWELVSPAGKAKVDAPAPFSSMRLYRRGLARGRHELNLTEYSGQWVVVGFAADEDIQPTARLPKVELIGARTRHHVYDPGEKVKLSSSGSIQQAELFHNGALVQQAEGTEFSAPRQPGRYLLQITFEAGRAVLPLTVGFEPCKEPGWPKDFFPIHFYTGWGYVGGFDPNPKVTNELTTLAQFEVGANTFFANPEHEDELLEALNVRRILQAGNTKYATREVKTDQEAIKHFLHAILRHGPFAPDVLGFYVEDEPGLKFAQRIRILEEAFREKDAERYLLYCLVGNSSAEEFWQTVNPTVRMARSYPVATKEGLEKAGERDQIPGIRHYVAGNLARWQSATQESRLWLVVQSFSGGPNVWGSPTPHELRLMVNLSLGRGLKALTYFCWGSSPASSERISAIARYPYVPQDDLYAEVGRINAKINALRPLLVSLKWVKQIPQPTDSFDVQLLETPNGRQFAWVTNWDCDRQASGTIVLPGNSAEADVNLAPGASEMIELR